MPMLATIGGGSARGFGFGAGIAGYWQGGVVTETIVRPTNIAAFYGNSVDLNEDGTYAIVGQPANFSTTGWVNIYSVSGTTFTLQAAIEGGSGSGAYQNGDEFGYSAAISGDGAVAVIGAIAHDISINTLNAGDAYVFERNGSTWSERMRIRQLSTSDQDSNDYYGNAVDIDEDGTFVVVGSARDRGNDSAINPGNGAIYARGPWTGSAYGEVKLTASDGSLEDRFGHDVAISGNGSYIIVGSRDKDVSGQGNAGGVYIYERTGSSFSGATETIIDNPVPASSDNFGASVDINYDGTWAAIGSPGDDDEASSAGAVFVYKRTGSSWTQQAKLVAADAAASDILGNGPGGIQISNDGTKIVVGSGGDDPGGAAYIFERTGESWKQTRKLTASDATAGDQYAYGTLGGVSISDDGETVLIGASREDGGAGDPYSNIGCVYHYTK